MGREGLAESFEKFLGRELYLAAGPDTLSNQPRKPYVAPKGIGMFARPLDPAVRKAATTWLDLAADYRTLLFSPPPGAQAFDPPAPVEAWRRRALRALIACR